jgi:hypothetical protein
MNDGTSQAEVNEVEYFLSLPFLPSLVGESQWTQTAQADFKKMAATILLPKRTRSINKKIMEWMVKRTQKQRIEIKGKDHYLDFYSLIL